MHPGTNNLGVFPEIALPFHTACIQTQTFMLDTRSYLPFRHRVFGHKHLKPSTVEWRGGQGRGNSRNNDTESKRDQQLQSGKCMQGFPGVTVFGTCCFIGRPAEYHGPIQLSYVPRILPRIEGPATQRVRGSFQGLRCLPQNRVGDESFTVRVLGVPPVEYRGPVQLAYVPRIFPRIACTQARTIWGSCQGLHCLSTRLVFRH